MSIGFLPVAADLSVNDEVLAVDTHTFAAPVTVTTKRATPEGGWSLGFSDGTVLLVGFDSDVMLRPPF
jgi:hypothetical protein